MFIAALCGAAAWTADVNIGCSLTRMRRCSPPPNLPPLGGGTGLSPPSGGRAGERGSHLARGDVTQAGRPRPGPFAPGGTRRSRTARMYLFTCLLGARASCPRTGDGGETLSLAGARVTPGVNRYPWMLICISRPAMLYYVAVCSDTFPDSSTVERLTVNQ